MMKIIQNLKLDNMNDDDICTYVFVIFLHVFLFPLNMVPSDVFLTVKSIDINTRKERRHCFSN